MVTLRVRSFSDRRRSLVVGFVLAFALAAAAGCGGGDDGVSSRAAVEAAPSVLIESGRVTDEALAAVFDGESVNRAVVSAFVAEVMALTEEERLAIAADLSRRAELEVARLSGLEAALGGTAATEAALTGAWAPVNEAIAGVAPELAATPLDDDASLSPESTQPEGFARPMAVPAPNGMASIGLLLGGMGLGLMVDPLVSSANNFTKDQYSEGTLSSGVVVSGAVEQSTLEMSFDGTQDGVAVKFNATVVVHPCPDPSGNFDMTAKIDVKTSKGAVGSNAAIDMKINGQVDDDAHIASSTTEANTQWADFAGGKGQFLDYTVGVPSSGDSTFAVNRTGGAVSTDFVRMAVLMSTMFVYMVKDKMLQAAENAWSSGRCVDLKITPSAGPDGLDPGQVVPVLAEPRSKVDGSPTGGNVTATLKAGVQSVEPNGSPVPADANSNYTAGPEQDQSGTVAYESRSKRGVGKAEVTFNTGAPAAYLVVGGLQDWQVNMVVCDITKPFTLESPGVGVAEFSGGLSGTYSATGVFNFSYAGTYQVILSDGLGSPGTMSGTSSGQIAGQAGSGTENYVLTPAEPCE